MKYSLARPTFNSLCLPSIVAEPRRRDRRPEPRVAWLTSSSRPNGTRVVNEGQATPRVTRRWYQPITLVTIAAFGTSCATGSLDTTWQTYQRERAQYEQNCAASGVGPHYDTHGTPCHMLYYAQHFHRRWNELIGRVPASDALWTEHEGMAREWGEEFLSHHDKGTPLRPAHEWVDRARATEERYALDIAQQLADREGEAEARRRQAIIALAALGLIASQVSAAITATSAGPRVYRYQIPTPSPASGADGPLRRQAEANWAARTGGATGGAMSQYVKDSLAKPGVETCTYQLNAMRGAMVCVDGRGTVYAR